MDNGEKQHFIKGAMGLAPNVSLKIIEGTPPVIVRNLKSLFCTMATIKMRDRLVMMDFAHLDALVSRKVEGAQDDDELTVSFIDYEFEPSASIVMPIEAVELFYNKMGELLVEAKRNNTEAPTVAG